MERKRKLMKWILIPVLCVLIGLVLYLGFRLLDESTTFFHPKQGESSKNDNKKDDDNKEDEINPEPEPEPQLQIYDMDSDERPIGIMVDNEKDARPQAGLQDAFLIYEIIIEGGQTRFFALFKDKDTTMIGPNRSARHYFIDYALENDAIYTHFGQSTQAERDINSLRINDISGNQADGSAFWRELPKGSYHNVFTSIKNLEKRVTTNKYRYTTDKDPLLNYSIDEINLNTMENARVANSIYIKYSTSHNTSYVYDATAKVYKRSMRGTAHVDRITKNQYTVKNIIVYDVKNYNLNDGSGKNRQGIENIGSGDGYYITNGYAVPITWQKTSRSAQTVYKYANGEEIDVNDGNAFIQIQPLNQTLTIQ